MFLSLASLTASYYYGNYKREKMAEREDDKK